MRFSYIDTSFSLGSVVTVLHEVVVKIAVEQRSTNPGCKARHHPCTRGRRNPC